MRETDDRQLQDNNIEKALEHWHDFAARFVKYEAVLKPSTAGLISVPISPIEFESIRLLVK